MLFVSCEFIGVGLCVCVCVFQLLRRWLVTSVRTSLTREFPFRLRGTTTEYQELHPTGHDAENDGSITDRNEQQKKHVIVYRFNNS